MRTIIHTDKAPEAIGPYSQGVCCGELIFTAGQIPLDPASGQLVDGPFEEQVDQVLRNLSGILTAGGSDLDHVIKFTVFLTDLGNFSTLNKVFAKYFADSPPARSAVQVAALPLGAEVEIEAVAVKLGA
ncbi:MAG: reactive intermediate/imine deaminase [Calditrichaeota bacterium]|nr:reactive intermediate/imine deaminase [Calditrichota bacterium]